MAEEHFDKWSSVCGCTCNVQCPQGWHWDVSGCCQDRATEHHSSPNLGPGPSVGGHSLHTQPSQHGVTPVLSDVSGFEAN